MSNDASFRVVVAFLAILLVSTTTTMAHSTHSSSPRSEAACKEPVQDRNANDVVVVSCATCSNGYFTKGNYCFCGDDGIPSCAKLAQDSPTTVQEPSRCLGASSDTPVDCTVCGTGYFNGCNHCSCIGGTSSAVGVCTKRSCFTVGGAYCLDPAPPPTTTPLRTETESPTATPTTDFLPQCIVDADTEPLEEFETTFRMEYAGPSSPFSSDENDIIDPILQRLYNEIVTCDTLIYSETLNWVDFIFFEGDNGGDDDDGLAEDPSRRRRQLQRTSAGTSVLSIRYTASGLCRGCGRSVRLFNDLFRRFLVGGGVRRELDDDTSATQEFYDAFVTELNEVGFTEVQSVTALNEGDDDSFSTTKEPTALSPETPRPSALETTLVPSTRPSTSQIPTTSVQPSSEPSGSPSTSIEPSFEPSVVASAEPTDVEGPRDDFVIVIRPFG